MELLKHFEEENKEFLILALKDCDWLEFVGKLPSECRDCYIADKDLEDRIKTFSSSKETELSEILPDEGHIKSGDFGEILSYFLFKERHKKQKANGPKKWRWKQERNIAAPYTDVILFSIKDIEEPSEDDLIISVESKMKSIMNNSYDPIQNSINGAEKDYVSRIANSLSWLRKKYKEEAQKKNASILQTKKQVNIIERFIKSETTGKYTKEIKAVAFVDKKLFKDEAAKKIKIPTIDGLKLEVVVVSVKDLKKVYEDVFSQMMKL